MNLETNVRNTRALVRRGARSYREYYARRGIAISLERADEQHKAYVAALEAAGLTVEIVEADERYPDGVFVEDVATVWNGRALIARMTPDREGEQSMVNSVLRPSHELVDLPQGATLDGGDVLHADRVTYVGLSSRTNQSGAEAVRSFLAESGRPVEFVPVRKCLHLKTAATYLGNGTLLAATDLIETDRFEVNDIIATPAGESGAANALRIHDHLLMANGYPRTHELLSAFAEAHHLHLVRLDISEFGKGDGSLSCLSIIC